MKQKKTPQDSPLKVLEHAYREMCWEFLPVTGRGLHLADSKPANWAAMKRIDARFSSLFAAAIVAE